MDSQWLAPVLLSVAVFAVLDSCAPKKDQIIARVSEEFAIPSLSQYHFDVVSVQQGFFECPIYHLQLRSDSMEQLKEDLVDVGFKDWKRGELYFDGASFGWREYDLEYAEVKRRRRSSTYYAAISMKLNEVLFIRYP